MQRLGLVGEVPTRGAAGEVHGHDGLGDIRVLAIEPGGESETDTVAGHTRMVVHAGSEVPAPPTAVTRPADPTLAGLWTT